jgi:hypothetical protein
MDTSKTLKLVSVRKAAIYAAIVTRAFSWMKQSVNVCAERFVMKVITLIKKNVIVKKVKSLSHQKETVTVLVLTPTVAKRICDSILIIDYQCLSFNKYFFSRKNHLLSPFININLTIQT